MKRINRNSVWMLFSCLATLLSWRVAFAQQHTLAFSSVDSPNANWYIAKERQLYKKIWARCRIDFYSFLDDDDFRGGLRVGCRRQYFRRVDRECCRRWRGCFSKS